MSEDKLIRLENLTRVVNERGMSIKELAERLDSGYSFARDLLAGKKDSFGEKLARKIEERLHLPRQWLDQVGAPIPPEEPDGNAPPADDLAHLLAQFLHDLADLPDHQRLEGANAAIGAVAEVKTGTTAKAAGMRKSAASADAATAPKKVRPRSPRTSPTAAHAAKRGRT